ncbi:hypothetical protein EV127DRAFT_412978 [Xylaria flabelliformis]|nr:hypothetical protein EV127DRAFT_412978 [Xylaria flabelliformis]
MPISTKGSKKKEVLELGYGHQQDNNRGRKGNLDQKAEREARFQRRVKIAPLAGSVPGNSKAKQQAKAAQTRADIDELDEQQRPAFPDPDWITMKSLSIHSTPLLCLFPLGKAPESTMAPSTMAVNQGSVNQGPRPHALKKPYEALRRSCQA